MDDEAGAPAKTPPPISRTTLVCSCEDTIPLAVGDLARSCQGKVKSARHLCRTEIELFRSEARNGRLTVACTQEEPLFREIAELERLQADLTFINIRETAGWAAQARSAAPKMAALLALAEQRSPPFKFVTLESKGVTLVLGRDEKAIYAARELAEQLDITVLLTGEHDVAPPRKTQFPLRRGIVRQAKGHLGAFELTIDGYAEPKPSSRDRLEFTPKRNGLTSRADIVVDLTGRPPIFSAADLREGYLYASPDDDAAIALIIAKAASLVGTFDKPRYVSFAANLCAHARSKITGCTRCLDLCPAGAISPAGDHVAIDPAICGGCGQCSAACPTGAVAYDFPIAEHLIARVRTLLSTYRTAGGERPVLLLHDGEHGAELIEAAARFSTGLPANVLPLQVNEATQVGIETIAAAMAYGATHVRILLRQKPRHDPAGLHQTLDIADRILKGLGFGEGAAATIETDDPDSMLQALADLPLTVASVRPAAFMPSGGKRDLMKLAMRELHRVAPNPTDTVQLPPSAPFGRVAVDTAGCTLCLSCVSACPTSALSAGDDRPILRFDESLCVQCGLCRATCPEKVISLEPRLNFTAFTSPPVQIKEEEPFCCISCGKAFGVRSTIDRIVSRLEGQHWMYSGKNAKRLDLVKMCEDCRVGSVTNDGLDPYAATPRPPARTTQDYLTERERQQSTKKPSDAN